jgi:ElaB/YqjD/DUF883 family membrane-anchored ribosome-binding protein
MTLEETADSSVRRAMDEGRQAADNASHAVKDGYDTAQQYIKDKAVDLDLTGFVRREPWLAIAAAFTIGYVAAQIVRRVS